MKKIKKHLKAWYILYVLALFVAVYPNYYTYTTYIAIDCAKALMIAISVSILIYCILQIVKNKKEARWIENSVGITKLPDLTSDVIKACFPKEHFVKIKKASQYELKTIGTVTLIIPKDNTKFCTYTELKFKDTQELEEYTQVYKEGITIILNTSNPAAYFTKAIQTILLAIISLITIPFIYQVCHNYEMDADIIKKTICIFIALALVSFCIKKPTVDQILKFKNKIIKSKHQNNLELDPTLKLIINSKMYKEV